MTKTETQKKLIRSWSWSYILVSTILLVLFLVFAMAGIYTVRNSVDKANRAALGALSNELNSAFLEVDALCEELILSDTFKAFSSKTLDDYDAYTLYQRTLDLRHMVGSRSHLEDCILYSVSNDLYITAQYYGKLSNISRNDVLVVSKSKVLGELISQSSQNYTYVIDVSDDGNGYNLLVIRPLSFVRSATIGDLCVAVLVDVSDIIPGIVSQTYDIVMYDTNIRRELFHFGSHMDGHYESEKLRNLEQTGGRLGHDRILVSESSIRGVNYYLIVDESEYFRDLFSVIWLVCIILILVIALALVVIRRIVFRHWYRFSDAVEASGADLKELGQVSNPYAPFVSSVTKLKEENRSHIISRLVLTEESAQSADELIDMGIFSKESAYCIVLAMLCGQKSQSEPKTDITEDLSEKGIRCIPFDSDYDVSLIAEANTEDFGKIHTVLENATDISYFAVSKTVDDPAQIHRMYIQACNIMEYRKTMVMSDSGSEGYAIYLAALSEIENNYNDVQLNVSLIADRLGVSIVYLSKCFKKHKETNISDYLTDFRIAKAKEILCDKKCWNLSMKDVSERCGFGSIRTFMRVFNKAEGVSPGQFKASALGSDKEG